MSTELTFFIMISLPIHNQKINKKMKNRKAQYSNEFSYKITILTIGIPIALRSSSVMCTRAAISTCKKSTERR